MHHDSHAKTYIPWLIGKNCRDDGWVAVPRQRELASAMQADVIEIDGDHFVTLGKPAEYSAATAEAVRRVLAKVAR